MRPPKKKNSKTSKKNFFEKDLKTPKTFFLKKIQKRPKLFFLKKIQKRLKTFFLKKIQKRPKLNLLKTYLESCNSFTHHITLLNLIVSIASAQTQRMCKIAQPPHT